MKTVLLLLALCAGVAITNKPVQSFSVSSSAFQQGEFIPAKYSCQGDDINPEIRLSGIPPGTKSLAIIMDDPDAPAGTFDHWLVWNLPVSGVIKENSSSGTFGKNGKGEKKYAGPCPPSGTHHYHFKIYALDDTLSLAEGADKASLENAMKGHITGNTELIGLYRK